jgi:hypothetical protein
VFGPDGDGFDERVGVCQQIARTFLHERLPGPEVLLAGPP